MIFIMKRKIEKMVVIPLLVVMGIITAFKCYAAIARTGDYVGITVVDRDTGGAVPDISVNMPGLGESYRYNVESDGTRFVFWFWKTGTYEVFFKAPNYTTESLKIEIVERPKGEEPEAVIVGYLGMKRLSN